jgi:hypothetical protein
MACRRAFSPDLRPAVGKIWLYFTAGAVWLGVGIMLIGFAAGWLKVVASPAWYIVVGIMLATGIYLLGFSRLAKKNICRIQSMAPKRICLFAFQGWRSYPLVVFMVFLGIYLRRYSPISKPMLAILYLGIGGGLLSSSLLFFSQIFNLRTGRPPDNTR